MDDPVVLAVVGGVALVAILIGVGVGFFLVRSVTRRSDAAAGSSSAARLSSLSETDQVRAAEARAQEIVEQARQDAERILKDADLRAKDEAFRRRDEVNRELEAARTEVREVERRAEKREGAAVEKARELAKKERHVEHAQKKLAERKELLEKKTKDLDALIEQETRKLHELTGLSREQAEQMLLDRLQRELADEVAARIQQHSDRLKSEAESRSREILTTAIQRYAAEHTTEATVSTVDIPDDNMKGRIIGREGRNIRTFEKCTGVDVIVDDTPGVVVVSAFDNVRREVARVALTKLIQDGRIHPTRIEEVVTETQKEMDERILEIGKQAVLEADVVMPHEKIVQLLGRLRFRTSYSQNVLQHSLEVAHLCGLMASELGLNPQLARRCGLLHDVGKAADHEMEGGHPKVGAELAKRYGETSKEVLHAIVGHHDEVTIDNIYTVLVAAADAISASRPGARRETLEKYVKRMEDLEAVACGFPEIDAAYAIQAGRELRVIANAGRTTDADAIRVCRDIARAIEQQLDYPGEIKVTVIRETRALEVAK
jgi:ribonuclease Y